MSNKDTVKNNIKIAGVVENDLELIAQYDTVKMYHTFVKILRLSGKADIIPIYISSEVSGIDTVSKGKFISLEGSIYTSQHRDEDGLVHTYIYVQVKSIKSVSDVTEDVEYINEVQLTGVLFNEPILRTSKSNKHIDLTELMLRVHRKCDNFEHIPVIVWGRDAKIANTYAKDSKVVVRGRFQSRNYLKNTPEGVVAKVTYEVSAKNINIISEE